jgi:hypothetical protein
MPWKISRTSEGYYVVNAHTGKRMSRRPLPSRARAEGQLRALYANVPEATEKARRRRNRGNIAGLTKHLVKKYGGDPHLFTKVYASDELAGYDDDKRASIAAKVHYLATGIWPGAHAGANPNGNESAKGAPGSGNFGHAGRPGKRGGSAPHTGTGAAMSVRTGRASIENQRISALAKQVRTLSSASPDEFGRIVAEAKTALGEAKAKTPALDRLFHSIRIFNPEGSETRTDEFSLAAIGASETPKDDKSKTNRTKLMAELRAASFTYTWLSRAPGYTAEAAAKHQEAVLDAKKKFDDRARMQYDAHAAAQPDAPYGDSYSLDFKHPDYKIRTASKDQNTGRWVVRLNGGGSGDGKTKAAALHNARALQYRFSVTRLRDRGADLTAEQLINGGWDKAALLRARRASPSFAPQINKALATLRADMKKQKEYTDADYIENQRAQRRALARFKESQSEKDLDTIRHLRLKGREIIKHKIHPGSAVTVKAIDDDWEDTFKEAPTPTVRAILEGKIHQSFTVAADQLFQRGYIDRDTRIALSGLIGDVLTDFGERFSATGLDRDIDPEDANEIAMKDDGSTGTVSATPTGVPGHGPGGLFSSPGLGAQVPRQRRKKGGKVPAITGKMV